jgi:predicted amidophosphoribosyltransferase
MICPQCQADNRPDSRFCHKCATPLQIDKGGPGQKIREGKKLAGEQYIQAAFLYQKMIDSTLLK